ncbi:probable ascorbate-specific transmembrane electron transporter 1 [Momordica charantia]|uniref:ascorbate ferrireductase (transmembrane) n=1 Tax=Momordica charantia TaxID=3673 RepID=A0A6J1DA84_MOMCH|nr:probable ascorbate-specific transmembrane electron transporter 1 [Momordica charantia]
MASKRGKFQILARPVTILGHVVAMAVAALILAWILHFREGVALKSANKLKILNLHVVLMVVGFILFGGEAIMAYKSLPGKKYYRKLVHLVLHITALACGIFGVCLAFKFHHDTHLSDLLSLHSWFGLITISLYALQWVFGFFAYFFPGAESRRRASIMPWHIYFGIFIFLMAICTAELGLLQRFNTLILGHSQEGLIVNFTGLLLLLYAATVVLTVILPPLY